MRLGFVTFVLLIATAIFACGDELPSVSDPPTQLQQATEPSAQQEDEERPSSRQQTRPPEAGRSAESSTDSETDEVEKEPPPEDPSVDETAVQEPEREAGETRDAPLDAEVEDAEPESEAEPKDLTNVPAVVMEDADVRLRPGLSWRVIDQLGAGEAVVVLNAASGWFRISFGDDREGWIRKPALDLGEIETRWILYAPAPAIVAEWQGEQHGVMGQSADGAEIRLLPMEDELAEMVSAPIDEVTLLADDITVHDLPILIGDETVVFPGDDFRAGQGKILPEANEWMWLPWGWLLAHNDTHIWQWRPETDELEFVQRPWGAASMSPDGKYLAIIECAEREWPCYSVADVLVVAIDGSARWPLRQLLTDVRGFEYAEQTFERKPNHLQWSANSRSLLVSLRLTHEALALAGIWLNPPGTAIVLTLDYDKVLEHHSCYMAPLFFPSDVLPEITADETIVASAYCSDQAGGSRYGYLVFDGTGSLRRLEPRVSVEERLEQHELLRSAKYGDGLGEHLDVFWSDSSDYALILDLEAQAIWIYESSAHQLRRVAYDVDAIEPIAWIVEESWARNWDVYWHGDEAVAVIPSYGADRILGTLLIDIGIGVGAAFDLEAYAYWACMPTGAWHPAGTMFQLGFYWPFFSDSPGENADVPYWIDGVAVRYRTIWQRAFSTSEGALAASLRTTGYRPYSAAIHRGEWSPNGDLFAIGGHQERNRCVFGS